MEFLNNFFRQKLINLNIPLGRHIIKKEITGNVLTVSLECETLDDTVNKLIPRIIFIPDDYNADIVYLLHKEYPIYNFVYEDIEYTRVKVIFKYKILELYLNLKRTPADIFEVIILYLDVRDYYKLINIIHLENYPDLYYRLSKFTGDARYSVSKYEQFVIHKK
jgi:hypothetical protein